ncbi:hypothetical protein [Mycolicibacterium lutetiense]|uniref:Uncharacterized protein n=1 Tax=Mycolicibacterium lutetiense TaxID=1641992 RepID=A0ABS4ZU19_9MYCO|nr:hypothetical protein [Mycolicibacterium lutetiense]MBP2453005.1 hypothetical protein [Mycolicibacterium lutetiense]
MIDRLARAFDGVQDCYLHDPAFADPEARTRHVEWLRTRQEAIARQLVEEGAADHAWEAAEDLVIGREIIGALPPRVVHERRHRWAYLEAEVADPVDPATVRHDELSTRHWHDRAAAATVDLPEPVGNPGDYRGHDPIEDVALAPQMHWTDVNKKAALEAAIGVYGIEPGQWFDLEWPPVAHLYDPGSVHESGFEPCEAHVEDGGDDVEAMAEWRWTTMLRINVIAFDHEGRELSRECYFEQAVEVATTYQDPRDVLIGPPGVGRQL